MNAEAGTQVDHREMQLMLPVVHDGNAHNTSLAESTSATTTLQVPGDSVSRFGLGWEMVSEMKNLVESHQMCYSNGRLFRLLDIGFPRYSPAPRRTCEVEKFLGSSNVNVLTTSEQFKPNDWKLT